MSRVGGLAQALSHQDPGKGRPAAAGDDAYTDGEGEEARVKRGRRLLVRVTPWCCLMPKNKPALLYSVML